MDERLAHTRPSRWTRFIATTAAIEASTVITAVVPPPLSLPPMLTRPRRPTESRTHPNRLNSARVVGADVMNVRAATRQTLLSPLNPSVDGTNERREVAAPSPNPKRERYRADRPLLPSRRRDVTTRDPVGTVLAMARSTTLKTFVESHVYASLYIDDRLDEWRIQG